MKPWIVIALIVACALGNALALSLKTTPVVKTVQVALNKDDVGKAKQILKQYFNQLKLQLSHGKHDELHENMIKTVNVVDENLDKIKPGDKGAAQDIEKILQSGVFSLGIYLGAIASTGLGGVGGVTGAVDEGLRTALKRLSKGNLLNTLTGTLQGALYGLAKGFINGAFTGFRLPLVLLTGKPMQNALKSDNVAEAKPLLQKYLGEMEQQMPKIKDDKTRENMLKTVNIISNNIDKIEPEDKGAMNDMRQIVKALVLFAKIGTGFGLGAALANVGGLTTGVNEGLSTLTKRLGKGEVLSALTGTVAGIIHGLDEGGTNNFFKGFRAPLEKN